MTKRNLYLVSLIVSTLYTFSVVILIGQIAQPNIMLTTVLLQLFMIITGTFFFAFLAFICTISLALQSRTVVSGVIAYIIFCVAIAGVLFYYGGGYVVPTMSILADVWIGSNGLLFLEKNKRLKISET